MELIRAALPEPGRGVLEVPLHVDRQTLVKRRWRGVADDGREFGFDLDEPLRDADRFFHVDGATYLIAQTPEPVLEVPLSSSTGSARLGWLIGNLHFPLEISGERVRVADDPALRQMFMHEEIVFTAAMRVFHPMRQGHVH